MKASSKQWLIDISFGMLIAILAAALLLFSSGTSEVFIYNNF